jgi:hypothetical protein
MKEIGPADDSGDDEELGPEGEPGAVERVDSCDHGLASLDQQLVAPQAEASLRVHLRPSRQEAVQLLPARGFNGRVLFPRSDLSYGAMIDRAVRPREISKDVLVVRPAPLGNHRLELDFPSVRAYSRASEPA